MPKYATELTADESRTVWLLAENNMNVQKTARELFQHRNTLTYHLGKIRDKTGLDPLDFFDLHELLYLEVEHEGRNED